ncbi:MAG: hypothetical protein IJR08_00125 [Bacilli bacterium]|nr:hypothetical protein [Bacilli bacterium]
MKPQYEFKKFPILATVLAAACLLFAVIGITSSLMNYDYFYGGPVFTGLLLVVVSVLVIAGLTTGRPLLLKVISIIVSISVIITNFSLTIAEYNDRRVVLFGIVLLALIASVLAFVYFLTVKTDRIRKMYLVTGSTLSVLVLAYAITFTIVDLVKVLGEYDYYEHPYYFILVSYALATALPMVIFFSLSKKEEPQEEPKQVEEAQEETK